jgi:hydrogenase nickel incorporation protein HypB
MCVVCGCADPRIEGGDGAARGHEHASTQTPATAPNGDLHYGAGPARVSVPGLSPVRAIKIEADILGENNRIARHNRQHFAAHAVTALNLVSSPGSGKTTLLCATIEALRAGQPSLPVAVIEGDQQTSFDADRIRATGAPAIQVNTGKGCHLDAPMVAQAFARLHQHPHPHPHPHPHSPSPSPSPSPSHGASHSHAGSREHEGSVHSHDDDRERGQGPAPVHAPVSADDGASLLFIENVGNLVCPAAWDLGEAAKVVVLSVTEGEDKPLKYPDMFAASSLMLLNKIDLLPHLRFDVARCIEMARRVNPRIEVIQLSAQTGEGMAQWLQWIAQRVVVVAQAVEPVDAH